MEVRRKQEAMTNGNDVILLTKLEILISAMYTMACNYKHVDTHHEKLTRTRSRNGQHNLHNRVFIPNCKLVNENIKQTL